MGERKRRKKVGGGAAPSVAGRGPRAPSRTPRLTGRTILWFLGGCLMLDLVLWAVFEFGLARCYGVLCLL